MPRPIHHVFTTPRYEKSFQKLTRHLQELARAKDQWFRGDAFDPRLRTHKLSGKLSNKWAYSVNDQYRVVFQFSAPGSAVYFDIGTHDVYR